MSRISNRDRLLESGRKVVLERGYVGASVRDIVEAAGVPQGSFTNTLIPKRRLRSRFLNSISRTVVHDPGNAAR